MPKEKIEASLPQYGRYNSVRILGEGATSTVYLAKDPNLARKVAIKVIKPHLLNSENLLARFTTEARVVANLRHANIVQVHDYDIQGNQQYLVMEFIEGPSLQSILNNLDGQPIPPLVSAYIIYQAALGLAAAHKQGLVHRDIKPDNLLLSLDGTVKVADFGIAHIAEMGMTQVGDILGTPYFMSPEQTMAEAPAHQSDLWALGVVAYYCLTGRKPFEGATFTEIKRNIRELNFQPMRNFVSSLDEQLVTVVDTLLQHAPEDRKSAIWLSQQLNKYLEISGLLDWEEFIKNFLGSLKGPSLLQTVVDIRQPMASSKEARNASGKQKRGNTLKFIIGAFSVGILLVVIGISIFEQGKSTRDAHIDRPAGTPSVIPAAKAEAQKPDAEPVNTEPVIPKQADTPPPASAVVAAPPPTPKLRNVPTSIAARAPAENRASVSDPMGANASIPTVKEKKSAPKKPEKSEVVASQAVKPTQAPKVELATLNITSSPPWAKVFIDGAMMGTTQFTGKLEPRKYRLKVYHPKFKDKAVDTTLELKPGQNDLSFQFLK